MSQDEKYVFAILMVSLSSAIDVMACYMLYNGSLYTIWTFALGLIYSYTGLTFIIDDD